MKAVWLAAGLIALGAVVVTLHDILLVFFAGASESTSSIRHVRASLEPPEFRQQRRLPSTAECTALRRRRLGLQRFMIRRHRRTPMRRGT
jgi:hypothetical protein